MKDFKEVNTLTVFTTTHHLQDADTLCKDAAIIDHSMIGVNAPPAELKPALVGDILVLRLPSELDTNHLSPQEDLIMRSKLDIIDSIEVSGAINAGRR